MDVAIRNGTLITPGGVFSADVGIVGERIDALGENLHGELELNAAGCYVLPGGIDPHVHLQMPVGAFDSADDFASGTVAAALGGTTTVIDFVEPADGEPFLKALAARQAEANGRVAVDYGLHMTIPTWHVTHSETLDALPKIVAAGVPSFKLYLAYEGFLLDNVQLYQVMHSIAAVSGLPIIHCEDGPLCEMLRAQAVAQGDTSPIYHALTRPPRQEAEAVSRAVDIAALAGSPVYIVHVSCEGSLSRIQVARARGEVVYGETCPQYLLLNETALDLPGGELLVCSPPLRAEQDNQALWGGLAFENGALDVLATDHCPFTAAEKGGHADFATIPGGLPSIEARLSLAYHFGRRWGMTLERWVEVCCTNPARIFGLCRKGQIAPVFDADLVVFDPVRITDKATYEAPHRYPEGIDLVMVNGAVVVEGGVHQGILPGRVLRRG